MVYVNENVLIPIFEELNDKKSLYSCVLVNRTWCEAAMPILWRNPGQYFMTNKSKKILFNVISLHLSKESRNILKEQVNDDFITKIYQQPLFNYIKFWKYLNLFLIENIINLSSRKNVMSNIAIRNEILKLFINNGNTKFTHLFIPRNFNYQLQYILGVEHCFSNLESLSIPCKTSQNILELLARTCKSIRSLRVINNQSMFVDDITGIIKLIEVQEKLNDVSFITRRMNKPVQKSLEGSLIKHADTIQYLKMDWLPYTRILSNLVNLLSFEIDLPYKTNLDELYNFESFQIIKNIKGDGIPPDVLANLIENTKIHLSEISICCVVYNYNEDRRLVQAIYQNCPNLRYLKLSLVLYDDSLISEFENLLINCKFLNELIIDVTGSFCWDKLFITLSNSSPINLFDFKFFSNITIKLDDIKLFFDNWKDRNPMLLKISTSMSLKTKQQLEDLIEQYKAKGIIKKYFIGFDGNISENLEWI
ncbi:hypothetical protein RclHR1_04040011 [Rhizophagus clarus]|uniref:F-box domain-containing protein n=1 Tax=Rhizophagus clarus TaxID=94130 RepID=A0A2Z6RGH7_9GLOM|nr:hypothetical protein RclHR1_04040011 [Rhizophagus clarus]GES88044.1 hypothetical protein GLOIN_2v1779832 [Rhizophagus clarus]